MIPCALLAGALAGGTNPPSMLVEDVP